MTQSLTGSWTKEITAGYAPPASEETGIRYPCPPTSLEAVSGRSEANVPARRGPLQIVAACRLAWRLGADL